MCTQRLRPEHPFLVKIESVTHVRVQIEPGHLFSCCVELNPVRAGLVARPEDYRWSSFAAKIGRQSLDWLDADPCRESLGRDASQRRQE